MRACFMLQPCEGRTYGPRAAPPPASARRRKSAPRRWGAAHGRCAPASASCRRAASAYPTVRARPSRTAAWAACAHNGVAVTTRLLPPNERCVGVCLVPAAIHAAMTPRVCAREGRDGEERRQGGKGERRLASTRHGAMRVAKLGKWKSCSKWSGAALRLERPPRKPRRRRSTMKRGSASRRGITSAVPRPAPPPAPHV